MDRKQQLEARKEQLSVELAEIENELLSSAPKGWYAVDRAAGLSFEGPDVQQICWNCHNRSSVYISDADDCAEIPADVLFAWVDRVRELGETDL